MNQRDFWDHWYSQGKGSGNGSVSPRREWVWDHFLRHTPDFYTKPVLDIGCGDLQFWRYNKHPSYTGVDFSPHILAQNRQKQPNWKFVLKDATLPDPDAFRAHTVLCLNVLYHIIDPHKYTSLLDNLSHWSTDTLLLYTWWRRPSKPYTQSYQQHHPPPADLPHHTLKRFYPQLDHAGLYIFTRKKL